ncbi:hydrophobin 1 [Trametes versicolor FP-101664 SS1]|uniref:hydrophobin 1 n=1 Tax=Trametes versicolor (strain FP-101664) TaxID=717944 RepID=UPI000462280B|nr:hydrophobin 1 [Trametes versicolor FP-101664 SS1]EIW61083.1 hydrophobin 1 [Trametes versicolor FP-101664 SS1]
MFSRTLALTISALPLLAVATPLEARQDCSTGALQCCDSTETAGSAAGAALLGLLGIVVQDVNVLLGVNCSPITVIGVGAGSSCSAQAVCCEDDSHGGLVSIGCVPVTL